MHSFSCLCLLSCLHYSFSCKKEREKTRTKKICEHCTVSESQSSTLFLDAVWDLSVLSGLTSPPIATSVLLGDSHSCFSTGSYHSRNCLTDIYDHAPVSLTILSTICRVLVTSSLKKKRIRIHNSIKKPVTTYPRVKATGFTRMMNF